MPRKNNKVSIIIRTKNEEQWIEICIQKILEQNYKNYEIIVVDNSSTDKTLEKIKKYKIKYLKINKFFPGKAINDGVKKSSGEYIVCLSAHCIPTSKNWLNYLIGELSKSKVAAVYGKQSPLPYSSAYDKRDLYNFFGNEKRVQSIDTFFHNANSAFKRKIWSKIKFDEKVLHIEDRIWAKEIIKNKYKIVYQPKAEVLHWHGVNHSQDEKRCAEIVSILENLNYLTSKNKTDLISFKNLKIAAIVPMLGQGLEFKNKLIVQKTISQLNKSNYINSIYLYSDNKNNISFIKKNNLNISIIQRAQKNYKIDIISSIRNALSSIEAKKKFYDLIVIATEKFPLRNYLIFDKMIKLIINNNYDVIFATQRLKGSVFIQEKDILKNIVNGVIPSSLNKKAFLSRIGVCTVIKTSKLRTGNVLDGNIGFYKINNPLSFLELNKEIIQNIGNKNFINQLLSSDI